MKVKKREKFEKVAMAVGGLPPFKLFFFFLRKRAFLVNDDRVLNGPLGRSLRSFARTAHSAHSAHSLHSALFTGSLTHFVHSLVGQLKFLNMCSHCYRVSREHAFWRPLATRP